MFDQINLAVPVLTKSISPQALQFMKSMIDINFIPPDGFLTSGEIKLLRPKMSVSCQKLYLLNFLFHKTLITRVFLSAKYFDRI